MNPPSAREFYNDGKWGKRYDMTTGWSGTEMLKFAEAFAETVAAPLRKEIEELERRRAHDVWALQETLDDVKARAEALEKYRQHLPDCGKRLVWDDIANPRSDVPFRTTLHDSCTCGLDKLTNEGRK
jgi:hypothetical protein